MREGFALEAENRKKLSSNSGCHGIFHHPSGGLGVYGWEGIRGYCPALENHLQLAVAAVLNSHSVWKG
ncbi:hypothetical protein ACOJUR_03425 [Alicyclobacillus tolerans]|uniref:hypothetical protein n=1 Tax=Alicyclobacillus tolerans TaxID=90970 RepID=UPI003B826B3F